MLWRYAFALLAQLILITGTVQTAFARDGYDRNDDIGPKPLFSFANLPNEPLIRVGLSTNARSASITTSDTQLVAYSPGEPNKYLAANRVSVSARAYRPPEVENYRFEIQNVPSSAEADDMAKDVREATGESAIVSIDAATNTWKIWIGGVFNTPEEADAFKAVLAEKGFEDAVKVTERKTVPSDDAVALTQQVRTAGKSQVRSIVKPHGRGSAVRRCACGGSEFERSYRRGAKRIVAICFAKIRVVRFAE